MNEPTRPTREQLTKWWAQQIPEGYREWTNEDELRHELNEAMHLIEFLHGCLTNPHVEGVPGGCSYVYPEMTTRRLERWRLLVADAPRCTAEMWSSTHPTGVCPVHHRLMRLEVVDTET